MLIKPDYNNLGLSTPMGPRLRALVEEQLIDDLCNYGIENFTIKFDWSRSSIEGHDGEYLDGYLENYSGIKLFDVNDNIIAEGWMDFIHELDFFLVYWDHLEFLDPRFSNSKLKFGIPLHIWQKIPEFLKWNYEKERM